MEEDVGDILLKVLSKVKGKTKMEVSTYTESLNLEELIHWIIDMEKHFEDTNRVKMA